MKRLNKGMEPSSLQNYRSRHPNNTWEQLRSRRAVYSAIKAQLLQDQGRLCAYCEVELLETNSPDLLDDFRVEHFIPKSQPAPPNWALEWSNLLAVCHGGSQKNVVDASHRCGELTCDAIKSGRNLNGIILNPLQLSNRAYFKYNLSGEMVVDERVYPTTMKSQAENTIRELKLNAERLKAMRKAVIEGLLSQVEELERNPGMSMEDILKFLAKAELRKRNNSWPEFFSVIRHFCGQEAEQHLLQTGYNG